MMDAEHIPQPNPTTMADPLKGNVLKEPFMILMLTMMVIGVLMLIFEAPPPPDPFKAGEFVRLRVDGSKGQIIRSTLHPSHWGFYVRVSTPVGPREVFFERHEIELWEEPTVTAK